MQNHQNFTCKIVILGMEANRVPPPERMTWNHLEFTHSFHNFVILKAIATGCPCMHINITTSGLSSWPLRLLMPSWRLLDVESLRHQCPLPVWLRKQLLEQVVSLRPSQWLEWLHHQRIPQRLFQRNQGVRVLGRKSSRNLSQTRSPSPLFPPPPRNHLRSAIVARAQQNLHMQARRPKLRSSRR